MKYTTRKAWFDELDYLDRLYARNMKEYVERVSSWDPDMFRQEFDPEEVEIIEVDGRIAGFIRRVYQPEEIYLAEVQIERRYQNQGLGTAVLLDIIDEAESVGKKLTLRVLKGNPAEAFYRRNGFEVCAETDIHLEMQWTSQ
jgi:GNAT superfamily N-acetyltransferase